MPVPVSLDRVRSDTERRSFTVRKVLWSSIPNNTLGVRPMTDVYYICTDPECDFATKYSSLRRTHEYATGHEVGVKRPNRRIE